MVLVSYASLHSLTATFYLADELKMEDSKSLVHKICGLLSDDLHFAVPFTSTRTNEADVVCLVVDQMCCIYISSKTYADCICFRYEVYCKCYKVSPVIYFIGTMRQSASMRCQGYTSCTYLGQVFMPF